MKIVQEYKILKVELKQAEKQLANQESEIKIINSLGVAEPNKKACIMLNDYYVGETMGNDWTVGERFESFKRKECEWFSFCRNLSCQYFEKYQEYQRLYKKYEDIQKKLNRYPLWVSIAALFVRSK